MKLAPAAWLLAVPFAALPAHAAEPTLWQRARDPGAAVRERARLRAEQLFEQASEVRGDPELVRNLLLGSASLLELGGQAQRDPWRAVLLGRLLLEGESPRKQQAMQLIEAGLPQLPDSEFKRQAWFDLGVASLRSRQYARGERAFGAALALAWDVDDRSIAHRNRGRSRMLSGQLLAAVADYRAAVALARASDTFALARFGLGVALERSGDYPQGLQEIARAGAIRLPVPPYPAESVLDWSELIWTPDYEVFYVRALLAMSGAAQSSANEQAKVAYAEALQQWELYLEPASQDRSPFLANAQRHQQRCIEALARLSSSGRVR
jgi:tetratricopeptide (TPR) repeat protein